MKKTLSFLALTLLLSMVGTFSALAASIVSDNPVGKDGVTYKVIKLKVYNKTDVREAEVSIVSTGTPKTLTDDPVRVPSQVTLNVGGEDEDGREVPQQDITFKVTVIEKVGYGNLNGVKHFIIPATIKEIKEGAFHNAAMAGNADLNIEFEADSQLETIGDYAFGNCAIKSIDLTKCNKLNLSTGKPFASAGTGENNYLEEVKLPKGIKEIGTAFADIPTLTKLDLSQTSVTVLEEGALVGTGIKEVILPKVVNQTVQSVKIDNYAFGTPKKPSKVETLIIMAPIAADGAIGPNAFKEMPALTTVKFQGDITLPNAIPADAFTSGGDVKTPSPIETLTFKGLGANVISDYAFYNVSTLKLLVFDGEVAGGAIGKLAFAGIGTTAAGCLDIVFKNALLGENAIGEQAFLGAAAGSVQFRGALAAKAIASEAFKDLNKTKDCYASLRFQEQLGERAIGQNSFENAHLEYVLFSKPINQIGAIRNYAFLNAIILGSATADWAIQFLGDLTAQYSIGKGAFQGADIRKAIWFSGNVAGDGANTPVITVDAFNGFKSTGVAGVPVLFKGNVTGNGVIDIRAFQGGSISTLTISGVIAGNNAIKESAFADLTGVGEINLGSRIYGNNTYSAIAPTAFANSGKATTVLNVGDLKSSHAIAAGAFAGAKFDVVNFSDLMAKEAIADNQFGAVAAARMAEGEQTGFGAAASINTVNFNKEFKAWTEVNNNADNNFIGINAFSNTGVSQVNFNEPVSVADAIVAETAEQSPFAGNGKDLTVDFKKGVVAGGIGANAFANSDVVDIELAGDAIYEEEAFAARSFYNISYNVGKPSVVVNYVPAKGKENLADRAFAQTAFYEPTDVIDVQFKTTKYVQGLYTEENQTTDLTPWRVKFIATKEIQLVYSPVDKCYVGVFTPENEMYAIDKYQEEFEKKPFDSRKEVGVWSAYVDGRTLEVAVESDALGVPVDPITPLFFNNWPTKNQFVADTYINPLRVQDHFYYLNPGHTLIITANYEGPVYATQCLDEEAIGGVQTFGDYNAWQCNDLRYNPAENKEWGGYVNFRAIQDGNKDWYGNEVREYELFRQTDFATMGIDFANSINLPEAQLYMLVTKDLTKRKLYSSYEHNKNWFTGHDVPWEETVNERIAAAVLAGLIAAGNAATEGYAAGLVDGRAAAEAEILAKLNEELDADNQKDNIDDAIAAIIDEEVEKAAAADEEKTEKIKAAGEALKEAIQNYVDASLAMAAYQAEYNIYNWGSYGGDYGHEYYFFALIDEETGDYKLLSADDLEALGITIDNEDGSIEFDDNTPTEVTNNFRIVFPMGYHWNENPVNQGYLNMIPFAGMQLVDGTSLVETSFYVNSNLLKSNNHPNIASYEKDLLTLIAKQQAKLMPEPAPGDNFYDVYKARANGDFDNENDPGFMSALEDAMATGDVTLPTMPDPVDADLQHAAEKWQAVKDIYTNEDFSDEAKAYIAASKEERRTLWAAADDDLRAELRAFTTALQAADPNYNSAVYSFVYDADKIATQDAAIAAYEEAVAAYNAEVQAAVRKAGCEDIAFKLYRKALVKNENANGIGEVNEERLEAAYPNFVIAKNNRRHLKKIDNLNSFLKHLQASVAYADFDEARKALGYPEEAVEDGEGNVLIPAVPASGLYDQIYNEETGLKAKKDAAVLALINAVNGIDVPAPARMNIIWNDRPANEVVGIMEAVVNGAVTKDGDNIIYNLNGMRVKTASKGIFIQNGKKVIK